MGFYGNITNTSKTQFQFDRIYPNRLTMENLMSTDNVYFGRYVLIEYDTETRLDAFLRVYIDNSGIAYTTPNSQPETIIYEKDLNYGDIVYTAANYIPDQELVPRDCVFWKCISSYIEGMPNVPAAFEKAVSADSMYVTNFNIDTAKYGESRGYDSTVWQKVYIDGIEKYIQIAELNSVVPTFDISADAPTVYPIQPHFDINSTNVYYKLHWQPQWGMRVKEASTNITNSQDNQLEYPSDESVDYTQYTYDPSNGNLTSTPIHYDAAIYYNKDGFNKEKHFYHDTFTDNIQVMPTGISGNIYNTHSNTIGNNTNNTQPDIQEFKILLPSLGNTISDIWDIMYGYNKKVNEDESVIETSDGVRFRDIYWKDAIDGREDLSIGGMTRDLNTFAGCINKIHDLMGMIITTKNNPQVELNEEWYNKNYLYEDNGKYYRIHKYPLYNITSVDTILSGLEENYPSDQEYNQAYRNAIQNLLQDKEYYLIIDTTNNNYKVKTLNEKAISALQETDIIGYKTDDYGYDFIEIEGLPGKMATIYGLILQMKKLLEVEDFETRDTATVTGAINTLNDIIEVFEDLIPGEFLICDVNGHVNSANWTTAQEFTFINHNGIDENPIEKEFNTNENRWISLSLDKENCEIELKHIFNPIENTTTLSNKNNISEGNGINNSTDDTLKLYTPIVDAMGHIVGKNTETVILPYNYKTISTIGSSANETTDLDIIQDEVSANGSVITTGTPVNVSSIAAKNTQDSLSVNPHNKWIQIQTEDNNISIAHEIHGIQTNPLESNLNNNKDTITLQDLVFDKAGHVIKNQPHTYILPYGFKTITPVAQSSAVTNPIVNTADIIANNTQDTLQIASSNKWIRMSTNNVDTLSIGHEVNNFEAGMANTKYGLETNLSITNLDTNNIFKIPVFKFDEAGHITMAETHTVTIPENFDKIAINTNGKDSVAVNNFNSDATIQANNLTDMITIDVGNRWIQLNGNEDTHKINLYHAAPGNQTYTTETGNETPNYGASFKIPEIKYDEAGHISGISTHTVTFPTPQLNNVITTESSILTNISMNKDTLEFVQTNANIGTRVLTEYVIGTNSEDILSTDSINIAFSKLQVQIHKLNELISEQTKTIEELNEKVLKLEEYHSNTE